MSRVIVCAFIVLCLLSLSVPQRVAVAQSPQYFMCSIGIAEGHTHDFGFVAQYSPETENWFEGWTYRYNEVGVMVDWSVTASQPVYMDFAATVYWPPQPEYTVSGWANMQAGTHTFHSCSELGSNGACSAMGLTRQGTFSWYLGPGPHTLSSRATVNATTPTGAFVSWQINQVYGIYYGVPDGDCISAPYTPTFTPTPSNTPTPSQTPTATTTPATMTPTRTPGPSPTLWTTPPPLTPIVPATPDTGFFASLPVTDTQDMIDRLVTLNRTIEELRVQIDMSTKNWALSLSGRVGVIPLFRGALMLFGEFEWLMIVSGWMIMAALLVTAVFGIRLAASLWGVVQRILEILDIIPFT